MVSCVWAPVARVVGRRRTDLVWQDRGAGREGSEAELGQDMRGSFWFFFVA